MRFLPDGPNIPEELLDASDHGDVIFFCGAGVSRPAGLPGFMELAQQVIERIGVPTDAPSRGALERIANDSNLSLDQVFQHLKYEYGSDYIDEVVGAMLDPPRDASTEQHAILLRLSRSAGGRTQIVTTNFDRLFERVDSSLAGTAIVAPALPDLSQGEPLEGIVYLHGRRRTSSDIPSGRTAPLILSSGDFGRAYLAQGWATRFMSDLLRYYTVVLVGYSANDPPVRYLLEGIHSLSGDRSTRIYAFDRGSHEVVNDRWRDRGVRVLAYPETDFGHASLWGTLAAWADRASDIDGWRRAMVELAARRPSELKPYQRGQVASLIRTDAGAKSFRESPVPPPAEWLCVFDRNIRYGRPEKVGAGSIEFDPLVHYGLDDDPPRPPESERSARLVAVDLISARDTEDAAHSIRLAGGRADGMEPITSRLFHLSHWLARMLDDPVFAWWAAGYESLHPRLLFFVESKLDNTETKIHPLAYRVWRLLVERSRQTPHDSFGSTWYAFRRMLKRDGWTARVLREFERVVQPRFACKRFTLEPPRVSWGELRLRAVANVSVAIVARDLDGMAIPSAALHSVFRVLRRGLESAAGMLDDIDTQYWRTATFLPEGAIGQRHLGEWDEHLLWCVRLFDRLAEERPDLARVEVGHWPLDEEFFFDKLRLYACAKLHLVPGSEVATGILRLNDAAFWNSYQRRELLHALAARWRDVGAIERERIEARIAAGPPRLDDEEESSYARRRAITAARILGWLQLQGAALSAGAIEMLPKLRAADPRWRPSWDERADAGTDTRVGYVRMDSDPSKLLDVPLAELVTRATQHTYHALTESVEYDPVQGLVERHPRRALAAVSYAGHRQQYPGQLWQTLLNRWPDGTAARLRWTVTERLVRLPTPVILEIKYAAADWLEKHLPALAGHSLDRALGLWDRLLEHFQQGGEAAAESGVGDTYIGGEPQRRSLRTYDHTINSSPGRLASTLLKILGELHPAGGARIPAPIRSRLTELLTASGSARDYAVSQIASDLGWLYFVDPEWVREYLLPRFDLAGPDAEPAWSGYSYDQNNASPELFSLLKPHFLNAFSWFSKWRWDDHALRHFTELLVLYCYWHQNGGGYISYAEARAILQQTMDVGRTHAVWTLVRLVKDQHVWQTFGKPFVENAWPRERRLQTAETSKQLADLARAADEEFPDAVRTALPLLLPLEQVDTILYDEVDDSSGEETAAKLHQRFPEDFLILLDRLVSHQAVLPPYGLGAVVDSIAKAEPRLRQDSRWRRLNEMANRG